MGRRSGSQLKRVIIGSLIPPLPLGYFTDISLNWNLTGWAVGQAMGKLAVKYYNRDLSALEPAIEPFR